jgi:acetylornithine deacetylase/succinyl-diaminopimelate desuccinylase-like protein
MDVPMDEQTLAWCERLIRCRSVTNEGTRAIAELCARELLIPHGIEPRLIESAEEGAKQVNLVAQIKGQNSDCAPLVFNTHLDTVPPGDLALWTACDGDPWRATVTDDRIYGLGAADTKLDFVAKATALIAERSARRDTWLVATFGEEHGLVGAKELARSGLLPRGALTFVGEPSRLEVITAHKGLMVFALRVGFARESPAPMQGRCHHLTFTGRAAHSSTPALGHNAILLALGHAEANPKLQVVAIRGGDAVNKVPARCEMTVLGNDEADAVALPEESARIPPAAIRALGRFVAALQKFADRTGPEEPDYAAPTLTCNPGRISSDADGVVLDFELRPPPGLALEMVREGVSQIAIVIANDIGSVNLVVEERRANPGFRTGFDGETFLLAMESLAQAGLPLQHGVKAGCTEAGIYAAAGLYPVVFGPGPSTGVIHAPNEYNILADVAGAIRFYRAVLRS